VISHDAVSHGPGRAGIFGGMWTAGETTGMALGATVLSLVLAVTGYLAHTGNVDVTQSAESVAGIVLSFSIVPGALIALSLIPLLRYRLRKEDIDA
jgi:glycoside/pentoside/hexuronide:cation symporter, GPH family